MTETFVLLSNKQSVLVVGCDISTLAFISNILSPCCFTGEVNLPSGFLYKPYVSLRCWRFSNGTDVSYLLSSSSSCLPHRSSLFYGHFIISLCRVFRFSCGRDQENGFKDALKTQGTTKRLPVLRMTTHFTVVINWYSVRTPSTNQTIAQCTEGKQAPLQVELASATTI